MSPQGGGELRVTGADGSNARSITSSSAGYQEGPISWSADSKYVIARSNNGPLNLVDVATGTFRNEPAFVVRLGFEIGANRSGA